MAAGFAGRQGLASAAFYSQESRTKIGSAINAKEIKFLGSFHPQNIPQGYLGYDGLMCGEHPRPQFSLGQRRGYITDNMPNSPLRFVSNYRATQEPAS